MMLRLWVDYRSFFCVLLSLRILPQEGSLGFLLTDQDSLIGTL